MLTNAQEKLIRSLETKKGRIESGLCLVEGEKNLKEAEGAIEFLFTPADTEFYGKLVDTVTPQPTAAVARIPKFSTEQVLERPVIVVLDGVQDPGNVGSILRLCLGFNASLVLIESADPSSPKVVRSSAGAFFKTPWIEVRRSEAETYINALGRPVYRLETPDSLPADNFAQFKKETELVLIAGSEGQGISLAIKGLALTIPHEEALESLNVATAIAIVLGLKYMTA